MKKLHWAQSPVAGHRMTADFPTHKVANRRLTNLTAAGETTGGGLRRTSGRDGGKDGRWPGSGKGLATRRPLCERPLTWPNPGTWRGFLGAETPLCRAKPAPLQWITLVLLCYLLSTQPLKLTVRPPNLLTWLKDYCLFRTKDNDTILRDSSLAWDAYTVRRYRSGWVKMETLGGSPAWARKWLPYTTRRAYGVRFRVWHRNAGELRSKVHHSLHRRVG